MRKRTPHTTVIRWQPRTASTQQSLQAFQELRQANRRAKRQLSPLTPLPERLDPQLDAALTPPAHPIPAPAESTNAHRAPTNQTASQRPYSLARYRQIMRAKLRKVGLAEFDQHHAQLMDDVVDLYAATQLRTPTPEALTQLKQALDKLHQNIQHHFHEEERFMETIGYPALPSHRALHRSFMERFTELRREIDSGRYTSVTPLFLTAFGWLFEHINTHDMQYARYYLEMRD
ncbi:MAG: hemerythrin family protein [Magnetococcales bacterium]|nr:hemerythrin family protein [Magnetococcales bacterium]